MGVALRVEGKDPSQLELQMAVAPGAELAPGAGRRVKPQPAGAATQAAAPGAEQAPGPSCEAARCRSMEQAASALAYAGAAYYVDVDDGVAVDADVTEVRLAGDLAAPATRALEPRRSDTGGLAGTGVSGGTSRGGTGGTGGTSGTGGHVEFSEHQAWPVELLCQQPPGLGALQPSKHAFAVSMVGSAAQQLCSDGGRVAKAWPG